MGRIALLQTRTGVDPSANASILEEAVAEAADGGASILFTPEMTNFLDRDRKRASGTIRPEDEDALLEVARRAAASHAIWVSLGSIAVRLEDGQWANRSILIDDCGSIVARYDKMHLFDVDVGKNDRWRESAVYRGGEGPVLARDTPVGHLGLSICYDLRFPALFASYAESGAQIVAVPAAFTVPTGEAHWHVLLRARAIEAGMFIVAAAQVGTHEDGRTTYGHSLVVDPWGDVLLDMGEDEGVGFAQIDLSRIEDVRARLPAIRHRRSIPPIGD